MESSITWLYESPNFKQVTYKKDGLAAILKYQMDLQKFLGWKMIEISFI